MADFSFIFDRDAKEKERQCKVGVSKKEKKKKKVSSYTGFIMGDVSASFGSGNGLKGT